jgi:hypothetical protein
MESRLAIRINPITITGISCISTSVLITIRTVLTLGLAEALSILMIRILEVDGTAGGTRASDGILGTDGMQELDTEWAGA